MDRFFNNQYNNDRQFGKIVTIFTILAFFISVLGLWALAAFTALKKVKEMGVRKVLGANPMNILYLFSREIMVLIVIAFLIATPLSILVMNRWLENFAFHIEIGPEIYVFAVLITISVALATVCWQSIKTAIRNPVEALRYE